jgi:Zn-dependent peptidase ImmA (M78 family)
MKSSYSIRHDRKKEEDPINFEANEFALKLLMPEKTIRDLIDIQGIKNIGKLAETLEVPPQAVIIRIEQLGYELKD